MRYQDQEIEAFQRLVIDGGELTEEQACRLVTKDLEELASAADEIRRHFCGDGFDICGVMSAKGGRCSENCKFCSQASCSSSVVESFALRDKVEMLEAAKRSEEQGAVRFSLVVSGRRLSDREIEQACDGIRLIREQTGILVCVSFGLLEKEDFLKLKDAGVTRIHNNLETSREHFQELCTSHTYEEKIQTVLAAKEAGLEVCCGGIIGIDDTMQDRIRLALEIRKLDVQSVPVNLLKPVQGTSFADRAPISEEEACRTISIFRFLLPKTSIRLAAGRTFLSDRGKRIFESGCNAAITGDMLTVNGVDYVGDMKLMEQLGYEVMPLNSLL